MWWSVRPHFSFGTVEVRICDAQATAPESEALAALMIACIAQAARDVDEGVPFTDRATAADRGEHVARDPLWHGRRLIDLQRGEEHPAREAIERLLAWTAPVRGELGIELAFPERNGAQRQRAMIDAGRHAARRFSRPRCARPDRPTRRR